MFLNVAVYKIHAAHVDTFRHRIVQHAQTTLRLEEGCLRFDVNQSREDPAVFMLIEGFRDRAAFDVHAGMPHIATFIRDRNEGQWIADRTAYQLDQIFSGDDPT